MTTANLTLTLRLLSQLESYRRDNGRGPNLLVHSLKCGALAKVERAPEILIGAALLHDIGHALMPLDDEGIGATDRDAEHAFLGAWWLRPLFPAALCDLVELHRDDASVAHRAELVRIGFRAGTSHDQAQRAVQSEAANTVGGDVASWLSALQHWDRTCDDQMAVVPNLLDFAPLLRRLAVISQ